MLRRSFGKWVLGFLIVCLAMAMVVGCEQMGQPAAGGPLVNVVIRAPNVAPRPPHVKPHPGIVAFGAPWCGACRAGLPKLHKLEARGVNLQEFNVDEHPLLVRKYDIKLIPVYFIYRPGLPTVRTGLIDEAVRLINEVLP